MAEEDRERVVVITGGAGAIGSEIGNVLSRAGHRVVALDRETEISCDLASEDETRSAAAQVLREHGRCDVLVHAAGIFEGASLEDLDSAGWRRIQAVNVESGLWLSQELIPGMSERGFGRVIFIVSSSMWSPPAPDMLSYVASKTTLVGIARVLARTYGAQGITVNSVAPGLTATATAIRLNPPEVFEAVREMQAIPRTLETSDISGLVAFLASDAAATITGQTICLDGGLTYR